MRWLFKLLLVVAHLGHPALAQRTWLMDPVWPDPPLREFFQVRYIDCLAAQDRLANLVPLARVGVDKRLNLLIVEGSPQSVDRVRKILVKIDRDVSVETQMHLLYVDSDDLQTAASSWKIPQTTLTIRCGEYVNGTWVGSTTPWMFSPDMARPGPPITFRVWCAERPR